MKWFLFFFFSATTGALSAQEDRALVIHYVQTMDISNALDQKIPGLEKPMSSIYRYEYCSGKSSYRFVEDAGQSGMKLFAFSDIYKDMDSGLVFLVLLKDRSVVSKDVLTCESWTLEAGEERKIAGYTCKKASSNGLIAWYCEAIPVSDGPSERSCGLPGMILGIQQGLITIEATRVEVVENGSAVRIPAVEKYHTPEEYRRRMGF